MGALAKISFLHVGKWLRSDVEFQNKYQLELLLDQTMLQSVLTTFPSSVISAPLNTATEPGP